MNATLPLRSNRSSALACRSPRVPRAPELGTSGRANRGSAMHQRHARLACGLDYRSEGARRDFGRIVVCPTLDHDADFDSQVAVVPGCSESAQIPPIREIAFAWHKKL